MVEGENSVGQIRANLETVSGPVKSGQSGTWRIRDYIFWGVIGFLGLSTLGSLARIANPEWAAQVDARSSLAAQNRAVAIDSNVYEPYSRSFYPKTFADWGDDWVKKIDKYRVLAAEKVALSSECDKVQISELSDARSSVRNKIVIWVECTNGKRFYFSASELRADAPAVSNQKATNGTTDLAARENARNVTRAELTSAYQLMVDNRETLLATPASAQYCLKSAKEGLAAANTIEDQLQVTAWEAMIDMCKLGL